MQSSMTHDINVSTATALALSPWWLQELHTISSVAAEIAPILGMVWFGVQIALKLYETFRRKDNEKD
jgi:hypothetical protein